MQKLLLRLWWLRQKRNFSWKDVLVGSYIIMFYVIVAVSFFLAYTDEGGNLFEDGVPECLGAFLTVGILVPDIISKWVMKRDVTAMDDYVKSRPIAERVWNRFLLLTNLVSFWNYVLPCLMLPVLVYLLSLPQAIVSFLMLLTYSYVDGIFITCYRKADEWMLKWPLVLGWCGMLVALVACLVLFSWLPAWLFLLGMFVLAACVAVGLVAYLFHLKNYNESRQRAVRHHSWMKTTLYSLQYVGLMRAKRVRNMVLMMVLVFFLDSLLMVFMPHEGGMGFEHSQTILYVVGDVLLPSVVLSQWTFGIEANYFQGLMTKPVRIERLLRNCYYFYLSISGGMTLLAVIFVFITDEVTWLTLVGAFAMAVTINLVNLPTCLFSRRLDIFAGGMLNTQGGNAKLNLYGILFLIPLALLGVVYYLWGENMWCMVSVALAIVSCLVHRKGISLLAATFERRKYQRIRMYET